MASGIPLIHGWQETLLCVHNIDAWVAFYEQVAEWQVVHDGQLSASQARYLGFDPDQTKRETLVAKAGAPHGNVRLVQPETRQPVIRSNARPWETGGWFDLNARVQDMATVQQEIQDLGWHGATDPVEYVFGPSTVIEWVVQCPDGIAMAMIQRLRPALEPDERPGKFGTHFNSTQIVTEFDAARRFYGDVLGFEPLVELVDEPMFNVLGLPQEVADQSRWSVAMLRPPGNAGGSIEIIGMPGLSGRDFSSRAQPPRRGIIGHRFPVDDLEAVRSHLDAHDVPLRMPPTRLALDPYGELTMLSARGPGGALLDFYQV